MAAATATVPAASGRKVAISLRGVSIGYGTRAIIEGIDLDIYEGEILFIGEIGRAHV